MEKELHSRNLRQGSWAEIRRNHLHYIVISRHQHRMSAWLTTSGSTTDMLVQCVRCFGLLHTYGVCACLLALFETTSDKPRAIRLYWIQKCRSWRTCLAWYVVGCDTKCFFANLIGRRSWRWLTSSTCVLRTVELACISRRFWQGNWPIDWLFTASAATTPDLTQLATRRPEPSSAILQLVFPCLDLPP